MKKKWVGLLAAGLLLGTAWGVSNYQNQVVAKKVKKTYKITTQDLVIPVGGRWNMTHSKFKKTDPILSVTLNGKSQSVSKVKVSGTVNVNKAGTYKLTYRYGTAKKTVKVTVSKNNTIYLKRGNLVSDGVNATTLKKYKTFKSRSFTSHNLKTTGASTGTWKLYGAFGPSFYKSGDSAYIQSVAKGGKYWYILAQVNGSNTKARVIRIKASIFSKLSKKSDLRNFLSWYKHKNSKYKKYKKYIKIGPVINVGHGQSMAYHNGALYITNQASKSSGKNINIIKISTSSLNKTKTWGISTSTDGITKNLAGLNMTFGSGNTFYLVVRIGTGPTTPKGGYQVYTGTLTSSGKLKFKSTGYTFKGILGNYLQGVSYNSQNKRLYLVTDGGYMSVPTTKLANNTLKTSDFHVTYIKGGLSNPLESESLQFSGKKAYYTTTSWPTIHVANWSSVAR